MPDLPETETGAAFAAGVATAEAEAATVAAAEAEATAETAEHLAGAAVTVAIDAADQAAEAEAAAWDARTAVTELDVRIAERLDQLAAAVADLTAAGRPPAAADDQAGPPPPEAEADSDTRSDKVDNGDTASERPSSPKKTSGTRYGARSWFGG